MKMKIRDTLIYLALLVTSLNVTYVYLQLYSATGVSMLSARSKLLADSTSGHVRLTSAVPEQVVVTAAAAAATTSKRPGKIAGEPEIWARPASGKARIQLPADLHKKSLEICARCLYKTLFESTFVYGRGDRVFIATGIRWSAGVRTYAAQPMPACVRAPPCRA